MVLFVSIKSYRCLAIKQINDEEMLKVHYVLYAQVCSVYLVIIVPFWFDVCEENVNV